MTRKQAVFQSVQFVCTDIFANIRLHAVYSFYEESTLKGYCQNPECRKPIEWTRKPRKYCQQPSCRKKMSRENKARKAQELRDQQKAQLLVRWKCLHLHPCVVEILEVLLKTCDLTAAQLATDAIEVQSQVTRRIDEYHQ